MFIVVPNDNIICFLHVVYLKELFKSILSVELESNQRFFSDTIL